MMRLPKCVNALTLITVPILFSVLLFFHYITYPEKQQVLFGYQLGWAYIFFVVGILWMTNVVPVSLPGFIPIIAMPLLGIVHSTILAKAFMSGTNMAHFGIIAMMMAICDSPLRRRLALRILEHGCGNLKTIYSLIFALTVLAAMWINATGATYLMMHVVDEIIECMRREIGNGSLGEERMQVHAQLESYKPESDPKDLEEYQPPETATEQPPPPPAVPFVNKINPEDPADPKQCAIPQGPEVEGEGETPKGPQEIFDGQNDELLQSYGGKLLFAIAVAANIGGNLWPYGSVSGMEMYKYTVNNTKTQIQTPIHRFSEASWMLYHLPLLIINALIAHFLLKKMTFIGSFNFIRRLFARFKDDELTDLVQSEYTQLRLRAVFFEQRQEQDPWTFQEMSIVSMVVIFVFGCLTRQPYFIQGWGEYGHKFEKLPKKENETVPQYADKKIICGDSVVTILALLLLFSIPKIGVRLCMKAKTSGQKTNRTGLAGWKYLQNNFPWAVLILIGASTLIGRFSKNAISKPIANMIYDMAPKPITAMNLVMIKLSLIGVILYGNLFISNTGTTIAALHIWGDLSLRYKGELSGGALLPTFSVASLCFFLPNSSVPTALVYRYKKQKKLSAFYFLRVGLPIFICLLTTTVIYAILWTPDSVMLEV